MRTAASPSPRKLPAVCTPEPQAGPIKGPAARGAHMRRGEHAEAYHAGADHDQHDQAAHRHEPAGSVGMAFVAC